MVRITKAGIETEKIELKRKEPLEFKKVLEYIEKDNEYPVHWLDKFRLKVHNYYQVFKIVLKSYKEAKMPKNQNKAGIIRIVITSLLSVATYFFGVEIPAEIVTEIVAVVLGVWSLVEFFLLKKDKNDNSINNN